MTSEECTAVAGRCRQELMHVRVQDVECEIHETRLCPLARATLPSANSYYHGLQDFMTLTTATGQCVSAYDTLHIEGTLGPYVKIPVPLGEIKCVPTSRHVVIRDRDDDESYKHDTPFPAYNTVMICPGLLGELPTKAAINSHGALEPILSCDESNP